MRVMRLRGLHRALSNQQRRPKGTAPEDPNGAARAAHGCPPPLPTTPLVPTLSTTIQSLLVRVLFC